MFWIEFAMLLWNIRLALEDLYGDLWFYARRNQHIDALLLMLSLGVFQCAGHIGKTNAKHIQSMPAVLVFVMLLNHVDSVTLSRVQTTC